MAIRQDDLADLEVSMAKLPGALRLALLREVTEMFVSGAQTFSDDQVEAFNVIIKALIKDCDPKALVELSTKLSMLKNAPSDVMVRLSYDNNIAVAGPILEKSNSLADVDLISVAKTKGTNHRMAIASRAAIKSSVTDALVESGEKPVIRKITANGGAAFSEDSFVKLVNEARKDQELASLMAKRNDVPPELQPFIKLALT